MSASEVATSGGERGGARGKRPRSAVTSGRQLFIAGDPNTAWSRRYYDLFAGHVADLGGRDALSEAQASLCRRASAIECELEQMESRLSRGEEVDIDRFARVASQLRRLFETLGLQRVARDVTPTLQQYIASKRALPVDSVSASSATETAAEPEKRASDAASPSEGPSS